MADITTNQTYLNLISTAIQDFDSIYGALVDRGVASYGDTLTNNKYDTGIATAEYAGLIRKLYKVTDESSAEVSLGTYALTYKPSITNVKSAINNKTGVITLSPSEIAVIDSKTTLTGTLKTLSLTETSLTKKDSAYVYANESSDTIISDVSIKAGSVEIDLASATISSWEATATTKSVALGTELGTNLKTELGTTDNAGDYKAFTLTPTVEITGKTEVTVGAKEGYSISDGYISASDITIKSNKTEVDTTKELASAAASTLYIKKAGLKNVTANGDIGFNGSQLTSVAYDKETQTWAGEGYDIVASATLTVSGDITSGYLESDGKLSADQSSSTTQIFRVAKGSVSDITLTNTHTVSGDEEILAAESETDVYTIKVKTNAIDSDHSVTAGYITEELKGFNISAAEESTDIRIAAGSVTATSDISVKTVTGANVHLENGTDRHEIKINIGSIIENKTIKEGYVTEKDISVTPVAAKDVSIFLDNPTHTCEGGLTITAVDVDENGEIEGNYPAGTSALFLKEAPKGRDYFSIVANSTCTVGIGYTPTGLTGGWTETYYLPKAELKYIKDDEKGNLITVETGGYLPAGLLTEISQISGTLDIAEVYSSLTLASTPVDGKYTITAGYNGTSSSLGYFNGQESFKGGTLEIDQGKADIKATIETLEFVENSAVASGENYTLNVKADGTVKTTVTNGLIKSNDLTFNEKASTSGASEKITLTSAITVKKAGLSLSANTVDVDMVESNYFSKSETKFAVTPKLSASQTVTVTPTEGYLTAADAKTLSVAQGEATTYYLKEASVGSIATASDSAAITLAGNFDETVAGDYTINLAAGSVVKATVDVEEGYLTKKTQTNTIAVTGNDFTVAHGSVKSEIETVTTNVTSTDVALSGTKGEGTWYVIKGNASATSKVTVTEGYIKDVAADKDLTNSSASATEAQAWVKGVNLSTVKDTTLNKDVYEYSGVGIETVAGEGGENTQVAADVQYISVAESYAKHDIKVSLHADAMGSKVREEFAKLQARLLGNQVTKTTGAI